MRKEEIQQKYFYKGAYMDQLYCIYRSIEKKYLLNNFCILSIGMYCFFSGIYKLYGVPAVFSLHKNRSKNFRVFPV